MKNILCFGDSNTYGYTPDTHTRYDYNTRWTGILDKAVQKYGYHVIEEGLCGRTTIFSDNIYPGRNGSEALPLLLKNNYPLEYITIMLGTNDCKTKLNTTSEIIGEGIEILVNQVKIFDSNTKILLISPILLADGVWEKGYDEEFDQNSVEVSKQLKSTYKTIADKYDCMFLAASDYAFPDESDREHMNIEGHKALAEAVADILINDFSKNL